MILPYQAIIICNYYIECIKSEIYFLNISIDIVLRSY